MTPRAWRNLISTLIRSSGDSTRGSDKAGFSKKRLTRCAWASRPHRERQVERLPHVHFFGSLHVDQETVGIQSIGFKNDLIFFCATNIVPL